jgi:serine protease Do
MVKVVMDQLIKAGKVTRGWIGITIQELTPELAQQFGLKYSDGVLVSDVYRGSPAQRAGIMRGDVIFEYNGKKVHDVGLFRNAVAQSAIGSQVQIRIMRRDKEMTVPVTIAELPADATDRRPESSQGGNAAENVLAGMRVMDLNTAIAKQLGVESDEKGIVIVNIEPGAPADEAGLRRGDVITEINRQRITNLNDFNRIIARIKPGDNVLLLVNRGGRKFYSAIEPK